MALFSLSRRRPRMSAKKRISVEIEDMKMGVNTLFSETRLKINECKELLNMLLIEDGVPTKRWGTAAYGGVTFTNTPDGFEEYVGTDSTRKLVVIADGKAWLVDPAAGTKTEITGATFTQGIRCKLIQYGSFLYITNGTDVLARYDGSVLTTYTALATPTWDGTPIVRTVLTAGAYTYYYRVTAQNSVGETIASTEQSITVNLLRDSWSATTFLTLGWADVAGATKYVIYMADTAGYETKLDETTASMYVDNGVAVLNPYIEPPDDNTTAGPLLLDLWVSVNRLWGIAAGADRQRVYFTGTGVNRGNFSPAYGGGWIELEKGGRLRVVTGQDYQGKSHVFAMTPEGGGSIWEIQLQSVDISGSTFTVPIPVKIVANVGTSAQRSLIYVENDIFLYSPAFGMMVFGNEPNILGVLRTNELSAKIRPDIRSINGMKESAVASYYHEAKVFISFATSNDENDITWVFDRERGAWVGPWTIGCEQFGKFTDVDGETHFLAISGNKLIEFSENFLGDQGVAFLWRYTSPRVAVVKSWVEFAKMIRAYLRLRNAEGAINYTIRGTGKSEQFSNISSATINPNTGNSGLGWDMFGTVQFGDTLGVPTSFASESLIRYLRLPQARNLVRDVQWEVSGSALSSRATITGLKAEGFPSKLEQPLSWKL